MNNDRLVHVPSILLSFITGSPPFGRRAVDATNITIQKQHQQLNPNLIIIIYSQPQASSTATKLASTTSSTTMMLVLVVGDWLEEEDAVGDWILDCSLPASQTWQSTAANNPNSHYSSSNHIFVGMMPSNNNCHCRAQPRLVEDEAEARRGRPIGRPSCGLWL